MRRHSRMFARKNADRNARRASGPRPSRAMRKFIESTTDHPARLRTALDLIELGETGLDGVVKDAMAALPGGDMRNLEFALHPAGARVSAQDRSGLGERVGGHPGCRRRPLRARVLVAVRDRHSRRASSRNTCSASRPKTSRTSSFGGMIAVIAARADAKLAARVFAKLRELRRKVDAEPGRAARIRVAGDEPAGGRVPRPSRRRRRGRRPLAP